MRRYEAGMKPGIILAVLLAVLAFTISFDALRSLALACGINPPLAWMFPLIIDGSVLAYTWAAWAFKTRSLSTVYPWLMIIVFTVFSVIGNMLHARPVNVNGLLLPQWVASCVMASPPVALLAVTHMIVMAASRSLDDRMARDTMDEPDVTPTSEPEPPAPVPASKPSTPASDMGERERRQAVASDWRQRLNNTDDDGTRQFMDMMMGED